MKAGALTFSVTIYIICAVIAISLIMARRFLPVFGQDGQGAELGGNTVLKYISASVLLFLWFLFVLLLDVHRLLFHFHSFLLDAHMLLFHNSFLLDVHFASTLAWIQVQCIEVFHR